MKKRSLTLIAVFAAILVLVGLTIFLTYRPKPQDKNLENATIELSKLDKSKITRIDITRPDGGFVVLKKGDSWTVNYPYPIALSQYMVDGIPDTFSGLNAESVIDENPKDLAQYGLSSPSATAKVTMDDGTVKIFLLGDKTPTGGSYYLQVKGDPKVYAVNSYYGDQMKYKVADLRDKTIKPEINPDEVTYLKARLKDGEIFEMKAKTEAESKDLSFGMGSFIVTKPFGYPIGADSEKTTTFIQSAIGVTISDFVDDNPQSLAKYGLNNPWGEVTVRDKAATIGFQFGKDKDADSLYFKIIGKPNVYTTSKYSVEFLNTTAFDLVDKFAYIPNIEDVDRLDVTARGLTHTFAISRTVKKAQKEGEQDETIASYTADGKAVEEQAFKDFYQVVIGLQVEGMAPGLRKAGVPAMTTRYSLNKGSVHQVLVSYVPYNADFYGVLVNGIGQFAISKAQINKMLDNVDRFLKGEKLVE